MGAQRDKSRYQKRLEQMAGRLALKALSRLALSLPEDRALKVGAGLGAFMFRASRRYRTVAINNLNQVFGDTWTRGRIEATARDVFRHIGMNLVEFLRFPGIDPARLADKVRLEGEEHVGVALGRGKGILAITSHYGNFEMFGAAIVARGYRLSVIARDADDDETNAIINGIRERMGYKVFPRRNAARQSIAALRRNEVLGVLPDQNDTEGIFVPFFNRAAATAVGPAYMALHTNATVLPAFIHREPDNRHVVKIFPPIPYEKTGDREADIYNLTVKINQAIETAIREHPEQWFWLHNRWKKRPPEEAAAAVGAPPSAVGAGPARPGA